MTATRNRASPLRDKVIFELSKGKPLDAHALANACGTSLNCVQTSLNLWRRRGWVKPSKERSWPQKWTLGDTPAGPTPMWRPGKASQIQIKPPGKPDPKAVNRAAADRDWIATQEAATPAKPGEPETVDQWMARTGKKPQVLPGPVSPVYTVRPAYPTTR